MRTSWASSTVQDLKTNKNHKFSFFTYHVLLPWSKHVLKIQREAAEKQKQKKIEFDKWRAIRATVGGVCVVLAWVTCKRGCCGWRASVDKVVGVLALVAYWSD